MIPSRIIIKGGPGSGHRGHAGRPGKRGGSTPDSGVSGRYGGITNPAVVDALVITEAKHSDIIAVYRVEEATIIAKDGKVITSVTGELSSVNVPPANYQDAIMTHNHPPTTMKSVSGGRYYVMEFDRKGGSSQPFSPSDVVFAVTNDLQEVRVMGFEQGKSVLYRLVRPKGGWPLDITSYHSNTIQGHTEAYFGGEGNLKQSITEQSADLLHKHWQNVSDHFGIDYIKES